MDSGPPIPAPLDPRMEKHSLYCNNPHPPHVNYAKCSKISNTGCLQKRAYTNSADPDQTASEEAVWSGSALFAILASILRVPVWKPAFDERIEREKCPKLILTTEKSFPLPCPSNSCRPTWTSKAWIFSLVYSSWNKQDVDQLNPLCTNGFLLLVWYS